MGGAKMSQIWLLSWLTILSGLQSSQQSEVMAPTMIPVTMQTTTPVIASSATGSDHNGQVCSTWGNFHFSTYDGDFFQLPYQCNYILTTMCDSSQSDFNIQMRRTLVNNLPVISSFTIKLDGIIVILLGGNITVNDKPLTIPGYFSGLRIEKMTNYIKITSKLGVTVYWDEDNSLSIEMSTNYMNKTCGLCGDFNGITKNEFIENGQQLNAEDLGLKWKMDSPTEKCDQTNPNVQDQCQMQTDKCHDLLYHPAFASCHDLLLTIVYLEACVEDMCQCNSSESYCLCDTISEFSRQCAHAGGQPGEWRSENFCEITCPLNMVHSECGSPCTDTCSNQEGTHLCADHCLDGCICPPGTVLDDIENKGCIPVDNCSCTHNGKTYQAGDSFTRTCQECLCSQGRWNCINKDCPGTCSLLGGSHIITYDGKAYSFHGNCDYILSKDNSSDVTVVVHLAKCGTSDTETCLTSVKVINSKYPVIVTTTGNVLINNVATKLPVVNDQFTIFKPSTFYLMVQTPSLQVIIQLVPIMQVYLKANVNQKATLSGLCGNFNDIQGDDFKTQSGLIEGTATTFASTWKVTMCQDFSINLIDPCTMSVEKENYAKVWCEMLSDPQGPFSRCHFEVNPKDYVQRCKYDACACAQSEECMCGAVSSYVYACAARGVMLNGWRNRTCNTFTTNCPGKMEYSYNQTSCKKTCRSLSESDHTCYLSYTPVDGCACPENTYLNDMSNCVSSSECPCYVDNEIVAPMQVISKEGSTCTCRDGNLKCTGQQEVTNCTAPMVYVNCAEAKPGQTGTECQKSCHTVNLKQCMNTHCKSGCVCPDGLLADGQGGCVKEEQCPCVHNGEFFQPGQTVKADCNNCTCQNRKWECTKKECHSMCTIYGDSHYISFDGKRYTFNGNCEYMLAQDYCDNSNNGSFRIITENIPCGTTGTTCSKAIKIFLGNQQLLLSEENIKSVQQNGSQEIPYKVHTVGIYLVIEAQNSLTVFWDRKTSLMVKLGPTFKGQVCGLCGNYDGDWNNDYMTRGGEKVAEPNEFGNSWRVSPNCPESSGPLSPCSMRPYRQAWATKQCSILKSDVFSSCLSVVDPSPYYDACVQDTCACDAGGDCECFCTSVAAYAAACSRQGVCVMWRSPTICPLFCDYYNSNEGCEWHYKPCGQSCMKTCKNLEGVCYNEMPQLEGCFPQCPSDRPYLEEATMKCVAREKCGCYDEKTNTHYNVGDKFPSNKPCTECECTAQGVSCYNSSTACYCEYLGKRYEVGEVIYDTTDGDGVCIYATCQKDGTILRIMDFCSTTPPPTTTPTSTPSTPTSTPSTPTPTTVFDFTSSKTTTHSTTKETESTSVTTRITTASTPQSSTTASVYSITETTSPESHVTTPTSFSPPIQTTTTIETVPTTTAETVTISTTPTSSGTTPYSCQPCDWSEWFDDNYPPSTPDGKEIESISKLWKSGSISCEKPKKIECRATDYKDMPLSDLNQLVTCDATVGLICINKEQDDGKCLNYEIRVKCCDESCTSTTTPVITPTATQTISTTTEPSVSSTTPPTQTTTTIVVPPTTTETIPTTTEKISGSTTEPSVYSTTPPTETTTKATVILPTTTETASPTTEEISGTTTGPSVSSITPPTQTTTTTETVPTTTAETVTIMTSSTSSATTPYLCQPCDWSKWLDDNYPPSTPDGKEIESISKLWKSGSISCEKPKQIECRATEYIDVPLSDLGQMVTCDATVGLICINKEQDDGNCLNYEIRVKCCDESCTSTTTPVITPTATQTTVVPPTTTKTIPTTTKEKTDTTTGPSVSSTPPPTHTTSMTTVVPPTTTKTIPTTTKEKTDTTTGPSVSFTPPPTHTTSMTTVVPPTTTKTATTPTVYSPSTITKPFVSSTTPSTRTTTITSVISQTTLTSNGTTFSVKTLPTITVTTVTSKTDSQHGCCKYDGQTFQAGSVIYNTTDGAGWCYTSYCDSTCNVQKNSGPCFTSPAPSTISPKPTPTTRPTSTTTPSIVIRNCTYLEPPRQNGETWTDGCSEKSCKDGSVISTPVQCGNSEPVMPNCVNGVPPVKVYDKSGCCYHYECQCKCYGWGDPHYVTFDGEYYAFQGNCTYVLVQEIIKKYNFSVHIKNYMCDTVQGLACPDYLTIYYKSYKIDLRQTRNPTVNKVFVNNEQKTAVYSTPDFTITTTGIAMTLDIPAIQAQVIFKGMNFVISLPFSLFHNNTVGQCGKCDNNTITDCVMPDGKLSNSCIDMAPKWQVNDTLCPNPPPTPSPPTTPPPTCKPAICDVIFSKVFENCHRVIDPKVFYKACVYDVCLMRNSTGCFSLQSYAQMCASENICVDWRGSTNGQCAPNCPPNKVYNACGPKMETTCNSMVNDKLINCNSSVCEDSFREGCFCPNGTTLFSASTDLCTAFCGCTGPDGKPKQPGENWLSECNNCTCSNTSMGPVCTAVKCSSPEVCTKVGYKLQTVDCCPKCVCNTSMCPTTIPQCSPGYELVQNNTDSDCCVSFSCKPKQVCVYGGKEYMPGETVIKDSCEDCVCGPTMNQDSKLLDVTCTSMNCNTTCSVGFSYEAVPGQCCGNCVQRHCIYDNGSPGHNATTVEVGQSWTHPKEPCVTYNCTKVNNMFMMVKIQPSCPDYNPEDCIPGTEQTSSDRCCKTCQQINCRVLKNTTNLVVDNCISVEPVEVASCSGSCDTSSMYSTAANSMMHHCSCCQEKLTSIKEVQLKCADNTNKSYQYTYVEDCGCHVTECTDSKKD